MILEYLFLNNDKRADVENYNNTINDEVKSEKQRVTFTYQEIDKTDNWVLKYEIQGENERNAKRLSNIDAKIKTEFSPYIIINESSRYFNRQLYPLVNEFERQFRKFILLKAAIIGDDEIWKQVQKIDQIDFSGIYQLIFTDGDFIKKAKKAIDGKTKEDILKQIESLDEKTIWSSITTESELKIIKDNFQDIKNYRNDIMHAHNIGFSCYKNAKILFTDANNELFIENEELLSPRYISTLDSYDFNALTVGLGKLAKSLALITKAYMDSDSFNQSLENIRNNANILSSLIVQAYNDALLPGGDLEEEDSSDDNSEDNNDTDGENATKDNNEKT